MAKSQDICARNLYTFRSWYIRHDQSSGRKCYITIKYKIMGFPSRKWLTESTLPGRVSDLIVEAVSYGHHKDVDKAQVHPERKQNGRRTLEPGLTSILVARQSIGLLSQRTAIAAHPKSLDPYQNNNVP
jgi:hypothetical protein